MRTVDPMRRDYRGIEDNNSKAIKKNDLEDINNSDLLIVNATRPSWGTAMEMVYAWQAHKYIVEGARVSPWLREHTNEIVQSVDYLITTSNCVSESLVFWGLGFLVR